MRSPRTIDLLFVPQVRRAPADEDARHAATQRLDEAEPLIGGSVDLGALATEFLILGLDPYPRKPGAVFQPRRTQSRTRARSPRWRRSRRIGMATDRSCFRAPNRYSRRRLRLRLVRTWSMIPKRRARLSERIMRHQENRTAIRCVESDHGLGPRSSMSQMVRIALDAMGGDHGPAVVVAGAELALARHPRKRIPVLRRHGAGRAAGRQASGAASRPRGWCTPKSPCAWTTSRARRCATAAANPRCGSRSTR